jgi:hypothetical protein
MNDPSAEEYVLGEGDIPGGEYGLGEGEAPIRQYLLGALTPEERQQVEVRLLIDDEFHEQVSIIEDELIDEYLYGELSESDRQKLGGMLRSGPMQQRKLELAEDLGSYAAVAQAARVEPATVYPGTDNSWWRALRDFLSFRNPITGFSLALALLLSVLGGVWALLKVRRLEERLTQQEGARPPTTQGREQELQRQLDRQNARGDELAAELQRAQEQRAKLDDEIAALKSQERLPSNVTNRKPAPAASLAGSVFLPLIRSRSPGREPTLNIRPGAAQAKLILDLDVIAPADYKSFKAEVYEVDGALIGSSDRLSRQKRGGGNRLVWSLPADRFSTGEYRVVLTGLKESGQQEPIGIYYFRAQKAIPYAQGRGRDSIIPMPTP